jgi:hypothetical protein
MTVTYHSEKNKTIAEVLEDYKNGLSFLEDLEMKIKRNHASRYSPLLPSVPHGKSRRHGEENNLQVFQRDTNFT